MRDLVASLFLVDSELIYLSHTSGENAESIQLVLAWQYDNGDDYAAVQYERYLIEQPLNKTSGGTPQTEDAYKKPRILRRESVRRLRTYFDCV